MNDRRITRWFLITSLTSVALCALLARGGAYQRIATLRDDDLASAVAFSRKGEFIAEGGMRTIIVWHVPSWKELWLKEKHRDRTTGVSFSADETFLASSSYDGTVKIWKTRTGEELRTVTAGTPLTAVAWDGQDIIGIGAAGEVFRWAFDGKLKKKTGILMKQDPGIFPDPANPGWKMETFLDHRGCRVALFSADAAAVAIGCADKVTRILDVRTGGVWCSIHSYRGDVRTLAFTPSGRHIAIGFLPDIAQKKDTVRIYDAKTCADRQVIRNGSIAQSLVFVNDTILAGGYMYDVGFSDISTGDGIFAIRYDAGIVAMAVSPDGRYLAAKGGGVFRLEIWSVTVAGR